MNDGGDKAAPPPRKPRRRRLSRRRFWRRVAWGGFLVALLLIGTGPALRSLGVVSRARHSTVTMNWDVVRLSSDRRAIVIRVEECGSEYAGAQVTRVGPNVQLMVSTRADGEDAKIPCPTFDHMPTHVVHLGFALPPTGYVLASGCPKTECDDGTT